MQTMEDVHQGSNPIEARYCAHAMLSLESLPKNPAIHGLAVAIPMSLTLWALIGLLLWALMR